MVNLEDEVKSFGKETHITHFFFKTTDSAQNRLLRSRPLWQDH
jgi:hypothetical protein